jgi:hypothetical protein
MTRFARLAHPVVVAAFLACGIVQVFLAGLGVFDDPGAFITHREFGYTIGWLTLIALVLALVGREPRRIVGLSALLLVQFALQSVLVAVRADMPAVAALHPVNGFLLLAVAGITMRLSWAARLDTAGQPEREAAPRPVAPAPPIASAASVVSAPSVVPAPPVGSAATSPESR